MRAWLSTGFSDVQLGAVALGVAFLVGCSEPQPPEASETRAVETQAADTAESYEPPVAEVVDDYPESADDHSSRAYRDEGWAAEEYGGDDYAAEEVYDDDSYAGYDHGYAEGYGSSESEAVEEGEGHAGVEAPSGGYYARDGPSGSTTLGSAGDDYDYYYYSEPSPPLAMESAPADAAPAPSGSDPIAQDAVPEIPAAAGSPTTSVRPLPEVERELLVVVATELSDEAEPEVPGEASEPGEVVEAGDEEDSAGDKEAPIRRDAYFWNAWAEKPRMFGLRYEPLERLAAEERYRVVVNLADLPLDKLAAGIVTRETSSGPGSLSGIVEEGITLGDELRAMKKKDRTITLKLLLLPDPNHYQLKSARDQEIELDLLELYERRLQPLPQTETLKAAAKQAFVIAKFSVVTRRPGQGSIAVAVWSEETGPVDEFVFGFCIGEDDALCDEPNSISNGLAGVDSHRTTYRASTPDAALHFIEMSRGDARYLAGVFWDATRPNAYLTWEVDQDIEQLNQWLTSIFGDALEDAIDWPEERKIANAGVDLYTKLFPDEGRGAAAGSAFRAFVESSRTMADDGYPSLFVRVIGVDSREPTWLPIGLIQLPAAPMPEPADPSLAEPAASSPVAPRPPLGFTVRVEMPLERQFYYRGDECLARWDLLVPPQDVDAELTRATEGMGDFHRWAGTRYERMDEFDTFLRASTSLERRGIVITSHHENGAMWFRRSDALRPSDAHAKLGQPSVLIMNGCGTTKARRAWFVKQFNKQGVSAVIATHTEISGTVAGHFLDCFAEAIARAGGSATISDAYLASLTCLSNRTDHKNDRIGGRALTYALLGDGSVPLCPAVRSASNSARNPAIPPDEL